MAVNNNGIKISQLDQASNLNDGNIMPVVQDYVELGETVRETKKTTLRNIKEFFLNAIPEWAKAPEKPLYTAEEVGAATPSDVADAANNALNNAKTYTNTKLAEEKQERIQGDTNTLNSAKDYVDQTVLAGNEWLPPVMDKNQLPTAGLSKKRNYLCKVVADPVQSGVYQAVAGWNTAPTWVLFNTAVDFVAEPEMEQAINGHNTSTTAHNDIRLKISGLETDLENVNDNFQQSIEAEEQARQEADNSLGEALGEEIQARAQGDTDTLAGAKEYTDEKVGEEAQARANGIEDHNVSTTAHADIRDILLDLIGLPVWDSNTHILTFTARNNSQLVIDLPIESLASDIDYDPDTKEVILLRHDGTEIRVSVSDLVDVYEGSIGANIQVSVDSGNVIRAALLAETITETELSSALLQKINNKLDPEHNTAPVSHPDIRQSIEELEEQMNMLSPEGLQNLLELKQMLENQFYLGLEYEQKAGGYTPAELVAMGVFPADSQWALWSHRAERYELVPKSYTDTLAWDWYTAGAQIHDNQQYRIYKPTGDDQQIWKSNKAIASCPAQLNPLDWDLLPNITRVRRCDLHTVWTDNDLPIGAAVTYNGTVYVVTGILVSGGKYRAAEGGNRGTFNSATAGDAIRNIYGRINDINCGINMSSTGAFSNTEQEAWPFGPAIGKNGGFQLDTSRIIPIGPENSPRTTATRHWRLVARG